MATDPSRGPRTPTQREGLLDAVLAVSAGLELSDVLTRIVRAGCELVGATYGALGVLAPNPTHLVEFITHGITDEERARIGEPPRGHGVLGLLISDPRPRRIAAIADHVDSYGFPPNHPPMGSFLGAPIRVRDEVFGNLYLTNKVGAAEFTADDESLVVALAGAAGVAIENARLYERSQAQRRWAQAVGEVTQALLESESENAALAVMADQVCRVSGARACAVAREQDDAPLAVVAVHQRGGLGYSTEAGGPGALHGPHWDAAHHTQRPTLLVPDGDPATAAILDDVGRVTGFHGHGPTALVPITAGGVHVGLLLVSWHAGDEDLATDELGQLDEFSQHAALALIAARAQHDRAVVAMLEDRERIARDMHDHVIQRLFATGLSLQASERLADHPVVRTRIEEAVVELDLAIKDIRQAIHQLTPRQAATGLRARLEQIVRGYAQVLGFEARLELFGDAAGIGPALEMDASAVVREGLANVARHAGATTAVVKVSIGRHLEVVVVDDGVGVIDDGRRSGLANLAERATARDGRCEITSVRPHGTRLAWTVPAAAGVDPARSRGSR